MSRPHHSGRRPRAILIQPTLASYRQEMIESIAARFELTVLSDTSALRREGFASGMIDGVAHIEAPVRPLPGRRLMWQKNVLTTIIRTRPDVVLSFANPRFASLWLAALLCRLLGIPFLGHTQGPYRTLEPPRGKALVYRALGMVCTRLVAYTARGRQSLLACGCPQPKILLAENSLQIGHPVASTERRYDEPGILYIGRLRAGSDVDLLIEACRAIRTPADTWRLHVVGGGQGEADLRERFAALDWIDWHGAVYSDARITAISRQCRLAVYPGNVGLSVMHYFGLALPVIIHDQLSRHFPEAEYVHASVNGFLFPAGAAGLQATLRDALDRPPEALLVLGRGAQASYERLNSPPLGQRMCAHLEASLNETGT